ncbi:GDP-L-fucose synthase [Vibrio nigripulchritudo ATCC 27043]|uniref:GDP-L-fucose synthase family protein n=1 Tax=Vibrio nigripulchritudo TaxID=28173 RepID=UPI00021C1899|nr:GDP-L-fucose synthase [Vibrio nigripulchritudo]EGU56687.1 GDP-L-fucose synthase [Vibrio nigripulchritudo ATCC 27043]
MKVFVAGHNGMVGSAICRILSKQSKVQLLVRDKSELDLLRQREVFDFLSNEKPDVVIIAAAKVGGIYANSHYPGEFIYNNLQIQNNLIHGSHLANVDKILFLGSSCIYPKMAPQPIREEFLLKGSLEPTNEPYAIAKIAGIKMCESYNREYGRDYRSVMPTNLYGPKDNFHPENSHVIPALIRRFHEAKLGNLPSVKVWGSGKPKREFLFVDDMASACVHLINLPKDIYYDKLDDMQSHINVGYGEDISIKDVANTIKEIVGFQGEIVFDSDKPDGTPRKLLDSSLLRDKGWKPEVSLSDGLKITYEFFKSNF